MNGSYRFLQDGKVIGEGKNLITTAGKDAILQFLAGQIPAWAASISIGVGETAATTSDDTLDFELGSADVSVKVAKIATGEVVVKATMPSPISGKIYEAGVFTDSNRKISAAPSALLLHCDPDIKTPVNSGGTHSRIDNAGGARVGRGGTELSGLTSSPVYVEYQDLYYDLSGHIDSDEFALAYAITGSSASYQSIVIQFRTDASNYFSYTFTPTASNAYTVKRFTKGSCTAVGSPSWSNISSIRLGQDTSTASERTTMFDGLRIDDTDSYDNYTLVSRAVLGNPILLDDGVPLEIEYTLDLNWS